MFSSSSYSVPSMHRELDISRMLLALPSAHAGSPTLPALRQVSWRQWTVYDVLRQIPDKCQRGEHRSSGSEVSFIGYRADECAPDRSAARLTRSRSFCEWQWIVPIYSALTPMSPRWRFCYGVFRRWRRHATLRFRNVIIIFDLFCKRFLMPSLQSDCRQKFVAWLQVTNCVQTRWLRVISPTASDIQFPMLTY